MKWSGLMVCYEDNHLLAVNKPAGVLVQGDITGDIPLSEYAKEYIRNRYNKPGNVFIGVTHRLDRPVSGVLLFARTSKALPRLNRLFEEGNVQKTYWAITYERPQELSGTLVDYLVKDRTKNIVKALDGISKRNPDAKRSELSYRLIASIDHFHLLEVKPKTGRSHQIRVQLAKMGSPIVGDVKYGGKKTENPGAICLHARKIALIHPVKKEEIEIRASLPEDKLWDMFREFQEQEDQAFNGKESF